MMIKNKRLKFLSIKTLSINSLVSKGLINENNRLKKLTNKRINMRSMCGLTNS